MNHDRVSEHVVRQRDADRTKAELLAEATAAFAESGFSGTRVDDIAERSSSTKRMIYYYFGSKEQLYLAVLENAYREVRQAEQALEIGGLDPVEAVRRLAEFSYDHHLEHGDFVRLVAIENIHKGRFIGRLESLREANKPVLSLLDEILSRGRAAGLFREDVDALDVHLVISSYCVFHVANRYTFGYLFDPTLTDPHRKAHFRAMIGDVVVAWLTRRAS